MKAMKRLREDLKSGLRINPVIGLALLDQLEASEAQRGRSGDAFDQILERNATLAREAESNAHSAAIEECHEVVRMYDYTHQSIDGLLIKLRELKGKT